MRLLPPAADVKDLALRAGHAFWQSFVAVFGGAYAASAANYHINAHTAMTSVSGAERFGLAVLVAVGAAALSALKTTAQNWRQWSSGAGIKWDPSELGTALAVIASDVPVRHSDVPGIPVDATPVVDAPLPAPAPPPAP